MRNRKLASERVGSIQIEQVGQIAAAGGHVARWGTQRGHLPVDDAAEAIAVPHRVAGPEIAVDHARVSRHHRPQRMHALPNRALEWILALSAAVDRRLDTIGMPR